MKWKTQTTIFIALAMLLLCLTSSHASPPTIDVGPHTAELEGGLTRGFWFTAPTNFRITGLYLPTDVSTASFDVAVLRFNQVPPEYSGETSTFETLLLSRNNAPFSSLATDIAIYKGDIIGILGSRGTGAATSYGLPQYASSILGSSVTLKLLLMQNHLRFTDPVISGVSSSTPSTIGRVFVEIAEPDPFPWALFMPRKIVERPNPQWTAKSGLCCTVSNMTFTVTLDGTTKSSVATPSSTPNCSSSSISVEPYTETSDGYKSFTASVAGGCINNGSGTFTYTFIKGNAYTFVSYLDGPDVKIRVTSIPLSGIPLTAGEPAKTEVFSLFSLEDSGSSLSDSDSIGQCATP